MNEKVENGVPTPSAETVDAPTAQDQQPRSPETNLIFHPIRIKGEPLSETIIRERR
jgi:hypothetical protein